MMLRHLLSALVILHTVTCKSCKDKDEDCDIGEKVVPGNDTRDFKLTVIVLTMNRPQSLARLMRSIEATDFEFEDDYFDMEIHVDKSIGWHYDECVRYVYKCSSNH